MADEPTAAPLSTGAAPARLREPRSRSPVSVRRTLAGVARAAGGSDTDSALYARRMVQLYTVLVVYGAIALVVDGVQNTTWVHWPRLVALAGLIPVTFAAARGWLPTVVLRASEAVVYLVVVAETTAENVLSHAPAFGVAEPATVVLFLRACFIPSRAREQAIHAALLAAAVTLGAYTYLRVTGNDLNPFLAGKSHAVQLANVVVGGIVFGGITTYAAHTIGQLRTEVHDAQRMGQYVLESRIGAGGMGEVWRAQHALLQRPTAVKVIRGNVSAELVARFEREVRAAAQLTHANSVAIYDFGVADGGRVFYAMELLDGLTLEQMVEKGGPMPASRVVHLLSQLLGALEEAHLLGIVHRDVKPANVMVIKNGTEHDFAKLLDYGLVHLIRRGSDNLALTAKGERTGTPLYMAPEMITKDEQIDGRSDLYALGAAAYYLLTGVAPFEGQNATQVLLAHVTQRPLPPSQRSELGIPADVEAVILRALEKRPEKRFANAAEMRAALRKCACAGRWTEEMAAEWWRINAPTIDGGRQAA
jgi:serine/threonine-protein kinase